MRITAKQPGETARRLVTFTVVALSLTACTTSIVGVPNPATGIRMDVADSELEIFGAGDGEVDRLVRNALADLNTFWSEQFPDVYGGDFPPLEGGYYSVDPDNFDPANYPDAIDDDRCLEDLVDSVSGNAYYCLAGDEGDVIVYDRTLLEQLVGDYGPFLAAMVIAHEFGHAIQGRQGVDSNRQIVAETQADCFAGAWTGWVATDAARHFNIRAPELDDLVRGLVEFRDPIGEDPDGQSSHGSYFDRTSAFQEGFDGGPAACRDNFNDDRIFTQIEFEPNDNTGGDATYDDTLVIADNSLSAFWSDVIESTGAEFAVPDLIDFDGDPPACEGLDVQGDINFCPSNNSVTYDRTDLTEILHDEIGDYAVIMALAIPYSLAVLSALDRPIAGGEALSSAVCLAGWYSSTFADGDIQFPDDSASISPGDIDEAVLFLVEVSTRREVLPEAELSGFQLVDFFRRGFVVGPNECGVEGLDG